MLELEFELPPTPGKSLVLTPVQENSLEFKEGTGWGQNDSLSCCEVLDRGLAAPTVSSLRVGKDPRNGACGRRMVKKNRGL